MKRERKGGEEEIRTGNSQYGEKKKMKSHIDSKERPYKKGIEAL